MNDKLLIPADASHEQIEIIVGALHDFVLRLSAYCRTEGQASASAFKNEIAALRRGDISMSLLDDAATFEFLVPIVDGIATAKA